MERLIQIGVSGIWETICLWTIIEAFLDRKKRTPWGFIVLYAVGTVAIAYFLKPYSALKFPLVFLFSCSLVFLFYEGKYLKKCFVCLLHYLLSTTVESVVFGTETILFPTDFLESGNLYFILFSQFLCKIIQFFFCILLYSKLHQGKELRFLSTAEWLMLASFPLVTIVLLGVVFWGFFTESNVQEVLLTVVIGIAFLNPVFFFLMFYVNRRENRIRQQELQIQKKQSQISLYENMRSDYEQQAKIVHDYKNQLSFLQNMLAQTDSPEALRYVEKLSGEITNKTQVVTCRHPVADVIINYKYHDAKRKNILMILKVGDLSQIRVEEYDLVVLLSNLLDNAIEACEKVQGKRVIRLEADHENGEFHCKLVNSASGDLVITDGKIESSKKDKAHHGIGLGNVKEIIEKYDGVYSFAYEKGEFQFHFSL